MTLVVVDTASAEAPYEQVRRQLAAMVASGELAAGEKLPTVRQLAADLGLATNTVARAYRELETDGVVETHGRKGTFVRSTLLGTEAREAARAYAALARRLGLSRHEAARLLDEGWATPD